MSDPCELNQPGMIHKRMRDAFHNCTQEYPAPLDYSGKDILKMTNKELLGVILDIKINALKLKPLEWHHKGEDPSICYDAEADTFCYSYSINKHKYDDGYLYECIPSDDVDCNSILFEDCDTMEQAKQKCWEHWQESIQDDIVSVMEQS